MSFSTIRLSSLTTQSSLLVLSVLQQHIEQGYKEYWQTFDFITMGNIWFYYDGGGEGGEIIKKDKTESELIQ